MAKDALNLDQTVAMLAAVADKIIASEPELTDADRALGDGDHGVGMQRGMTAVREKLDAGGFESIDKVFMGAGMAMMSSMGGASGALFGTLFRNGESARGAESFDAEAFAELLKAGLDGVVARGGAKPGDKTMIDALHPASERADEVRGQPLFEAAAAVAAAAEAGREASKPLVATMGRAKTLGEASVGHPDAGACSIAIILRAMSDYAAA